ncbi:MAG: ATP-binding cassette domain-containing protein [Desulfomonile tiedjei]|nr:ATP-binding cassette domain-containing protein [Desulfomonile tiedjei]
MSATIGVKALTKRFGAISALDNLDLEIEREELFGLLGPNGAGKTTLISILSTIVPPTSGSAEVCGYDVRRQSHEVRKRIGIVFQDPSLDDELTGDENLDFHGRLYGLDAATRRSRMEEVLNLVDLQERRRDLVRTYSGGMRRRLEIARGLMHRPEALFLDEPTLGLDPQTRRKIWQYIRSLKESFGMTVILTTHYMDEADQLCSRIAIIDRGRIVALDTPEALKASLGGDLLELETGGHSPEFLNHLADMEEIAHLAETDGTVILTVGNGESFIPRCFEVAQRFSVQISSVSLRKPNLEDVFIQLTGREIREEGTAGPQERVRIFMQTRRR